VNALVQQRASWRSTGLVMNAVLAPQFPADISAADQVYSAADSITQVSAFGLLARSVHAQASQQTLSFEGTKPKISHMD
jgi:hypothetical protein